MQAQVTVTRERLDFIWLELTARCNLECVHCYADSGPKRPLSEGMNLADWFDALDQAAALGCKKVQFIGGEPTLYPGLPALIGHARKLGYEHVCVYTNGTHFSEDLKAVFLQHRVNLAFSVYGSTGAVHDQVTRRNGSFDKTDRALRWAVDAGLPVRASIIAMKANAHDVHEAEQRLREAGVAAVHVDRLRGLGRGSHERSSQPPLKELCGRCRDGKVCVSSDGEIYPCVFARFASLGHVSRGGLSAAFGGQALRDFRDALIEAHSAAIPRALNASMCSPEQPAPPCTPERDPGQCGPEIDPGPCGPEIPAPDCSPEKPSIGCPPEQTAYRPNPFISKSL
ncbi:radical SAM/SPASM domain-containing protein [Dyella subtropica]|uniref:radical SAM/SPASM domain-containing protein n=1 Tax=Dyella subtropica TaxID=2992127 RepID=UPI00224D29C0|nr:radical SAM protein [Dyella subtropica]